MLLLRDGPITLVYIDSFIGRMRFWSSLPNYTEVFNSFFAIHGVKYWEGDLGVFLEPLSKCSSRFTNVLFSTFLPGTLIPVNHSTCPGVVFSVPGSHEEILDSSATFKMNLHSMLATNTFETFTHSLSVWHHYVCVLVLCFSHVVLGVVS